MNSHAVDDITKFLDRLNPELPRRWGACVSCDKPIVQVERSPGIFRPLWCPDCDSKDVA